jgi:hypothetical protein
MRRNPIIGLVVSLILIVLGIYQGRTILWVAGLIALAISVLRFRRS